MWSKLKLGAAGVRGPVLTSVVKRSYLLFLVGFPTKNDEETKVSLFFLLGKLTLVSFGEATDFFSWLKTGVGKPGGTLDPEGGPAIGLILGFTSKPTNDG